MSKDWGKGLGDSGDVCRDISLLRITETNDVQRRVVTQAKVPPQALCLLTVKKPGNALFCSGLCFSHGHVFSGLRNLSELRYALKFLQAHPKTFMAHPRHIPATSPLFCSWQPVVTPNLNFCTVNPSLSMKPRYFELAMRLFPIIPSANVMPYSEKIGRACAREGFPLLLFFSIAVRPLPRHGIDPFLRTTITSTTPTTTTPITLTTIATLITLIA